MSMFPLRRKEGAIVSETETKSPTRLPTMMRAVIQTGFGRPDRVLEEAEIPVPEPSEDQVLLRVAASSVNALDWHLLTGTPYIARPSFGLRKPRRLVPGADISGTVVALGSGVTGFSVGDEVFGEVGGGGFAEYATAPVRVLARRPQNLSLEKSSTLGVAALTALQGLRDWGAIQRDDRVLINGASGGVGTFAIQIARALGAGHVTAVCSTRNVETARALGADRVIDYKNEDFTTLTEKFDVFFDNAGSKSLGASRRMLAEKGTLVMITGKKGRWFRPVERMIGGLIRSRLWSQTFISDTAKASAADEELLAGMVADGTLLPVMDQRFTLGQAMEALKYQGEGHARGKSIVVPS